MNTASYHNNQAIWTELLPGGHHWSGRIQKGTILRFTSLGAQANVSLFCVNAADVLERFNMPDSLKGQHTAYLKASNVLYSDLGRVMASIVHDDQAGMMHFVAQVDLNKLKSNLAIAHFKMPAMICTKTA